MSDSDSFIQEVTEEVRQDRMFALWKKWAPFVLAGLVLIIAGTATWSWMQTRQQAAAEARGAALLSADAQALAEQQALIERLEPPAQMIAEFAVAAGLAREGEPIVAAQAYRSIAERGNLEPVYQHLALLQALRLEATEKDTQTLLVELAPLMTPEAPYAPLARELAAALHLRSGNHDAARTELEAILSDPRATESLRIRARELLVATGGETAERAG